MKAKEFGKKLIGKVKHFRLTRSVFSYPYIIFMLIFVVTPLVIVLVNAFIYDGHFSFRNFGAFFTSERSSRTRAV